MHINSTKVEVVENINIHSFTATHENGANKSKHLKIITNFRLDRHRIFCRNGHRLLLLFQFQKRTTKNRMRIK